jgi:hypothetical protein
MLKDGATGMEGKRRSGRIMKHRTGVGHMVSSFNKDIRTLFITRIVRMFAYGFLSVVLALYLTEVNLSSASIGVLFTVTLAGDAGITLWLTANADRLARC